MPGRPKPHIRGAEASRRHGVRRVTSLGLALAAASCAHGEPPDFTQPESVATGLVGRVTCAVSRGQVACRGESDDGVLGTGPLRATSRGFAPVRGVRDVQSVVLTLTESQACALASGRVWCWGARWAAGPLGANGAPADTDAGTPQPVSGLPSITALTAGIAHVCALASDGAAFCWGDNVLGAITDPALERRRFLPPTRSASPGARYTTLVAGPNQSCARTADRSVYCWGGALPVDGRATPAFGPTLAGQDIARIYRDESGRMCAVPVRGEEHCWTDTSQETDHAHAARRATP